MASVFEDYILNGRVEHNIERGREESCLKIEENRNKIENEKGK